MPRGLRYCMCSGWVENGMMLCMQICDVMITCLSCLWKASSTLIPLIIVLESNPSFSVFKYSIFSKVIILSGFHSALSRFKSNDLLLDLFLEQYSQLFGHCLSFFLSLQTLDPNCLSFLFFFCAYPELT